MFITGIGVTVIFGSIGISYLYKYFFKKDKNDVKEKDLESETESEIINSETDTIKKSIYAPPIDESKVNKILNKISENVIHNLSLAYDIIREDYDIENKRFKNGKFMTVENLTLGKFKIGFIQNIQRENSAIYISFCVSQEDYLKSLEFFTKVGKNK